MDDGENVKQIWNKNPGEMVVCDRYEYDEATNMHQFYLNDEIQGKLQGGDYVLAMDEFMITAMRDHPEAGAKMPQ